MKNILPPLPVGVCWRRKECTLQEQILPSQNKSQTRVAVHNCSYFTREKVKWMQKLYAGERYILPKIYVFVKNNLIFTFM